MFFAIRDFASLWIAVLGALQAVEYGVQSFVAGGFVLLDALSLARKLGERGCEAGAVFGGQDHSAAPLSIILFCT